ncbi:MAG: tetratricopeptide repeat protein [Rubrivivax sp.]
MSVSTTRLAALALLAFAGAAFAADTEPAAPARDKLAAARALVAKQQWAAAIDELKRVNDSDSADWNNLMGYTHRKAKTPDYAAAERYYDAALRIDPKHRGALEYSGELYLMISAPDKARARLATLEQVCSARCEEYADLKKAIAEFDAGGGKPKTTP